MDLADGLDRLAVVVAELGSGDVAPMTLLAGAGLVHLAGIAKEGSGFRRGANLGVEAAQRRADLAIDHRTQRPQRAAGVLVQIHEGEALVQRRITAHDADFPYRIRGLYRANMVNGLVRIKGRDGVTKRHAGVLKPPPVGEVSA